MTCSPLATLAPASKGPTMLVPLILLGFGLCLSVAALVSLLHGGKALPTYVMILAIVLAIAGGALLVFHFQAVGVSA